MSMIVKHNLTAMNSNRMLGLTTTTQAKATEKLSSGYKINRAADDAAGLAISEKMRKQIRGLTQASLNAQDGISAVQTADGALNEVHDMVQRLTELAVKAANGTLSESDRDAVQNEVDQLIAEIDRVSTTTKFNETYLLRGAHGSVSGSLSYAKAAASLNVNTGFMQGSTYGAGGAAGGFIKTDAQTGTSRLVFGASLKGVPASTTFNNGIKLKGSAATNTRISGRQIQVGTTVYVLIESTSAQNGKADKASASAVVKAINDAKLTQIGTTAGNPATTSVKAFTSMDSLVSAIRRQHSTDIKAITSYYDDVLGTMALKAEAFADLNDAIDVSLHVGTDSSNDNKIYMNIAQLSARGLGLNGLKMNGDDADAATQAIDIISDALQKVSNQRASLGAIQNRLEHTIANLDNVVENTTSAEASIRDTDMATQMVEYSNNQILAQAGQAMLAQANQATSGVLSLLQ